MRSASFGMVGGVQFIDVRGAGEIGEAIGRLVQVGKEDIWRAFSIRHKGNPPAAGIPGWSGIRAWVIC